MQNSALILLQFQVLGKRLFNDSVEKITIAFLKTLNHCLLLTKLSSTQENNIILTKMIKAYSWKTVFSI